MNDVGRDTLPVEREAGGEGAERRNQRHRTSRKLAAVDLRATHGELAIDDALILEAAHFHGFELGELPRQVLHMNAGAAVDVRRKLIGHEHNPHQPRLPRMQNAFYLMVEIRQLRSPKQRPRPALGRAGDDEG